MVGGQRIDPVVSGDVACVVIPHGAEAVELASATFSPAWWSGSDDRRLGLHLRGLSVLDGFGGRIEIALDDPALAGGLHAEEATDGMRRAMDQWSAHPVVPPMVDL